MSLHLSTNNYRAAMERIFPAVFHWSRLPGLISWAGVSLGTGLAFMVPFHTASVLSYRHFAGNPCFILTLAAGLGIAGIVARKRVFRFAAFLGLAFLLCCAHRAKQVDVYEYLRLAGTGKGTLAVRGKVCSAPLPYYENFHFLLRVESVEGDAGAGVLHGLTLNCISANEPPLYASVAVRGVFSPPAPRRNPFEYDDFSAQMARGIWGSLTAYSCKTLSVRTTFFERLAAGARAITVATLRKVRNYDNRALLQASFLGDTEFLSPFVKDSFRKSGIYHLIAISGLNTAMLIAALYFFLRFFPLGPTATHLICVAALWAYLPFVGMIPSLFRATIMATLVIAALLFEKKNYPLHTLGLAGTCWLLLSPESLFGPGYQLSFAATAGLFLLFPVLDRFTPRPGNVVAKKIVSFLFQSFFISISSFLATALILLYHFGTISYFGLVANLVAVSAMTIAMWAFFAGLFLQTVIPFLAAIPLWVAERFLDAVVWTGSLANHFSWSQVSYPSPWPEAIVVIAIVLAGFAAINREQLKRYGVLAASFLALFIPADHYFHTLRAEVSTVRFAIPKMSAAGIRWPGGKHWLFVTGLKKGSARALQTEVVPWLRHTGGSRFDALLVPVEQPVDTTALKAAISALSLTPLFMLPPSRATVFAPENGCTCIVVRSDTGNCIHINAHGARTTIELDTPQETGTSEEYDADHKLNDPLKGARIVRSHGKTFISSEVLRGDHPLY